MDELFLLASHSQARSAGFHGARHHRNANLRAWWPGRNVDEVRRLKLIRVVISEGYRRAVYDAPLPTKAACSGVWQIVAQRLVSGGVIIEL